VEITQSCRLAEGNLKYINNRENSGGESHLAEGTYEEKGLRILTASEPIIYTPLTAARAIAWYSPVILASLNPALVPLLLDAV
jgi:hypothetical protein